MARRRKKRESRPSAEVLIQRLAQDMLRLLGLRVGVRAVREKKALVLYMWGEDLALLRSSEDAPWEAFAFLLKQMAGRSLERSVNIVLQEVEDDPKRTSLRERALRLAQKVMRTGQPIELEPMPAWERREIHIALQDHPHVFTKSVGKEPNRRVRILPRPREKGA